MYTEQQFNEVYQQKLEEDRQALDADPGVQQARRTLEKAKSDLTDWQDYIASLPSRLRFQYTGNIDASLATIDQAEQGLNKAENTFFRNRRLQALAAKKAEQEAQVSGQEALEAKLREDKEKAVYRAVWTGTSAQFEEQWPAMYKRILEEDALQQVQERRRTSNRHAF